MDDPPEIPDEFENKDELEQYISQLHSHIGFLEEELEESEKDNLELRQELNQLEQDASREGGLHEIHSKLEVFMGQMEDIELHGTPDTDSMQEGFRNPDF